MLTIMLFSLILALVQADKLNWTDQTSQLQFDWSKLVRPDDSPWKVDNALDVFMQTQYFFNFGRDLPVQCGGQSASVIEFFEVLDDDFMTCTIIGRHQMSSISLIDKSKPSTGISLTYDGGENCIKGLGSQSVTFLLYCSSSESDWEIVDDEWVKDCQIVFEKYTKFGCATNGSFSFFSRWKLFLGVILGYFIIATMFNIYQGKRGLEALPHYACATGIISTVTDNVKSLCNLVPKYDQV